MTTVHAPSQTLKPGGPPSPASGVRGGVSSANVAVGCVLALGMGALFAQWFYRQHRFSAEQSADWGHAYLVPLISLFYVWKKREQIARIAPAVFWPGLLPLLAGIAVYFVLSLSPFPGIHMFQGFALVGCVAGLTLLLQGPRRFTALVFPVGYLAFGVTIADKIMGQITFQLQLLASHGASLMLRLMGYTVDMAGNVITLTLNSGKQIPLNVAEACSGMRMVVAFLALGVAVAFFSCEKWWQRTALVLLATPVALLTNVVRVVSLGIASIYDSNLAAGDAHTFIGVLWLIPGFMLFMALVWVLKNLVREETTAKPAPGAGGWRGTAAAGWAALRSPAFLAAAAILLVSSVGLRAAIAAKGVYLAKLPIYADQGLAFHSLPTRFPSWERVGADDVLSAEVLETLGTENYLSRKFVRTGPERGAPVELHLAYYTNMVDTVPHVPERCFVGGGMSIVGGSRVTPIRLDMDRFFVDRSADPSKFGGPVLMSRDSLGRDVRMPRGVNDLSMNVTRFVRPGSDRPIFAGYFFIANGGLAPRAEDVRLLAFNLTERYAYYAKVQFTSGAVESEEELAAVAAEMLNEMLPDIMRRVPDWIEVVEGRYPSENPGKAQASAR